MLTHEPDEELLRRLLGRSPTPTAKLAELLELDSNGFTTLGFSKRHAEILQVTAEIARRHQPASRRDQILEPEDVLPLLTSLRTALRPTLVAILGDRNGRFGPPVTVAEGGALCASPEPALIVGLLRDSGSSAVILAHNHTEGLTAPTRQDLLFSKRIAKLGDREGYDLVDHIIVGQRWWFSLRRMRSLDR